MGKRQVEKPLRLCKAATSAPTKPPFIFIIAEINRANLPAVFGDLLYCLEYRGKQVPQPTEQVMQGFPIPENIYLIRHNPRHNILAHRHFW
jgi:5-methylcytosine-specific restriction protein B